MQDAETLPVPAPEVKQEPEKPTKKAVKRAKPKAKKSAKKPAAKKKIPTTKELGKKSKAAKPKGKQGVRADGKPRKLPGTIVRGDEKSRALGLRIRTKRTALGMTQSMLAGRAGIRQGTLSFIEGGQKASANLVAKICKCVGLKA